MHPSFFSLPFSLALSPSFRFACDRKKSRFEF